MTARENKTCACGKEFTPKSNRQIHCHRRCHNPRNYNGLEYTDAQRNYKLKLTYGISLEEYNQLFTDQEGCCAICRIPQSELRQNLHVDHNHDTNEIRGLLCQNCNFALGLLKDDPALVRAALEYVS